MGLWFISREHHAEVVAAKDALIRSLETQNAVLAERLAEPVAVTVKLPEDFAVLQSAIVRRKRPQDPSQPATRKEAKEVDWANVDLGNSFLMAELAAQEYGRMLNPVELADWMRRVSRQVAFAKQQDNRTPEIPNVGTLSTKPVPQDVLDKITAAERV